MANNPIVATLAGSPTTGEVWEIFPGKMSGDFSPMTHLHLTSAHLDELILAARKHYQDQLDEAILNFPIL